MIKGIVVSIVKKRGRTAGCIITLDSGETIECSADLIAKHNIVKKMAITQDTLDAIARDQRLMDVRQAAMSFVAFKPRTSAQVRRKLADKDYTPEEIEEAIQFLKEFKYLDDIAYARSFINDLLLRKATGKSRIAAELKKRGIAQEDIRAALAEIFPENDTMTLARDAATKKIRTVRHKPSDKQRSAVVSYLARQGFAWDVIRKVIEELGL